MAENNMAETNLAETVEIPTLASVHIMLPEAIDRRFERWTKKMPGTSWPAWGGHVTLIPNFALRGSVEEVRAAITAVCVHEEPFLVRLAEPVAIQDMTRPDYHAVFLLVDEDDGETERLRQLRMALLADLAPLREDLRPELLEQRFMPHVTLALGLGESEAARLVKAIRADPLIAEFMVEVVWLVVRTPNEGGRVERIPVPLGRVSPVELLRD
jgi:2'-5' RNA ligase